MNFYGQGTNVKNVAYKGNADRTWTIAVLLQLQQYKNVENLWVENMCIENTDIGVGGTVYGTGNMFHLNVYILCIKLENIKILLVFRCKLPLCYISIC